MAVYLLDLAAINTSQLALVGGKGMNLGELSRIQGINVPHGFCVTSTAYREAIASLPELDNLLTELSACTLKEPSRIAALSAAIRQAILRAKVPAEVADQVRLALNRHGADLSYAVRSSATAEDLPGASFAGQQETYLNIRGLEAVLQHVVRCWASLFTERAVTYRIQNGFDHRSVALSVVIQRMVDAEVSGIMFTADPVTSDRRTLTIEAGYGLGEALVSGLVDPDQYRVAGAHLVAKRIGAKQREIRPDGAGGTVEQPVSPDRHAQQALSDQQILTLADLGKRIEAHFGMPQDIEWCFAGGQFYIVQSRPITTLFPIPQSTDPRRPRVFMSVGHTQMMTGAMKPLGMSIFAWIAQFRLDQAGARLFADITHDLSSPVGRQRVIMATGKQDPLMQAAVRRLMEDRNFMASLPKGPRNLKGGAINLDALVKALQMTRRCDPGIIDQMLTEFEKEIQTTAEQLSRLSGAEALAFIQKDRERLTRMAYDSRMLGAILASLLAGERINRAVRKWLDEKSVADILSKSVDHDVTTEMGLALADAADSARRHPEVVQFLSSQPEHEHFFEKLMSLPGGEETAESLRRFLAKYGMRCPGEIDITRPRWAEKPTQLLPMLLSNIRVLAPGEHLARFEQGRQEAAAKEAELIRRLLEQPGGRRRAEWLRKNVRVLRTFAGCREYPKYYIIRRFQLYKEALLREGCRLAEAGVIDTPEDIYYLTFEELVEAVRTAHVDRSLIKARKDEYLRCEKLTPPRIITSDGWVPAPEITAVEAPAGALPGIPVSAGTAEGTARVVHRVEDAQIQPGEILVTHFTDPSWTPLFVAIRGLVTEVGGYTTHGAVVAREYGLPAVVGVQGATQRIRDGQRIRVNGTEGYVELL